MEAHGFVASTPVALAHTHSRRATFTTPLPCHPASPTAATPPRRSVLRMCDMEPKAAEPKAAEPQAAEPQAAEPQAAEPQAAEPAEVAEGSRSPVVWLRTFVAKRKGMKAGADALRNYGVAAVISYGLFDAFTYSLSFLLSLRGYLATGKELSWSTLPQVLALMWGINNLSRPFRIAGAIALAPVVDRRVVKPISAVFSRLRSTPDQQPSSTLPSPDDPQAPAPTTTTPPDSS